MTASEFNNSGQRINEIDLDAPRHGTLIDDMTPADWEQAEAALEQFDRERGLR